MCTGCAEDTCVQNLLLSSLPPTAEPHHGSLLWPRPALSIVPTRSPFPRPEQQLGERQPRQWWHRRLESLWTRSLAAHGHPQPPPPPVTCSVERGPLPLPLLHQRGCAVAGEHLHTLRGASLRGEVQCRPPLVVPHVEVHEGFGKCLQGFTVTIIGLRSKQTASKWCLERLHPGVVPPRQFLPLGPSSHAGSGLAIASRVCLGPTQSPRPLPPPDRAGRWLQTELNTQIKGLWGKLLPSRRRLSSGALLCTDSGQDPARAAWERAPPQGSA